ncbi:MAG TPA: YceI family protein [bacterium]|nr:YceI family protein [bacterium]
MKKVLMVLAFIWGGFSAAAVSQAAVYKIDPDHSSITFKVKHLTISTVMGKFSKFSGTFNFDEKNPTHSKVEVTIDPASVDTGVKGRDDHLRSDAFFEVETYPTATFKSTKVSEFTDSDFTIEGNLTLHGVTKPVVLKANYEGSIADDQGQTHAAFSAETEINRQDYGIDFSETLDKGGLLAANEVKLFFEIEGVQTK